MPIYVYHCPSNDPVTGPDSFECPQTTEGHDFEKILPMSECGKTQPCPGHGGECQQVDYPTCNWVWGYNEIHWSAGTTGNPRGMNHAKRV